MINKKITNLTVESNEDYKKRWINNYNVQFPKMDSIELLLVPRKILIESNDEAIQGNVESLPSIKIVDKSHPSDIWCGLMGTYEMYLPNDTNFMEFLKYVSNDSNITNTEHNRYEIDYDCNSVKG